MSLKSGIATAAAVLVAAMLVAGLLLSGLGAFCLGEVLSRTARAPDGKAAWPPAAPPSQA